MAAADKISGQGGRDGKDGKDGLKICPMCKTRPRYVTRSGILTTYCLSCRNKRACKRYRDDAAFRTRQRDRLNRRYRDDPDYRSYKREETKRYIRDTGYQQTDSYRLSSIKYHLHRLTDSGVLNLAEMVAAEERTRLGSPAKR